MLFVINPETESGPQSRVPGSPESTPKIPVPTLIWTSTLRLDAADVQVSVAIGGLPFADAGPANATSETDVNMMTVMSARVADRFIGLLLPPSDPTAAESSEARATGATTCDPTQPDLALD